MRLSPEQLETIKDQAQNAWNKATPNQRAGIRFGMTDINLLKGAGFDPYGKDPQGLQKAFVLALMDCATASGGMKV